MRSFVSLLKTRLEAPAPLIQVLIGPRQVGKTTGVKQIIKDDEYYQSADSPVPLTHEVLEEWWKAAMKTRTKTLIVDEVQKIIGWSEIVKKLWDQSDRKIKVVLLGSAALLVEKGLKESLAGRFELIQVKHWSYAEAKSVFDLSLKQYIEFGCYPGSIPFLGDLERWGGYVRDSIVEPAIGRDLIQLHPVQNSALFRQVFHLCISLPSQVVSLNKLQGQLHDRGALQTIQSYLHILEQGFLVSLVEKYSPVAFRSKRSQPKIIVNDNALLRSFERPISAPLSQEKWGRYFENIVGARFIESGWSVYYWSDRDKEVDFVCLGPSGERWAVEVKSSQAKKEDFAGLLSFCRANPEFSPKLVSLVYQEVEGIESVLPENIF